QHLLAIRSFLFALAMPSEPVDPNQHLSRAYEVMEEILFDRRDRMRRKYPPSEQTPKPSPAISSATSEPPNAIGRTRRVKEVVKTTLQQLGQPGDDIDWKSFFDRVQAGVKPKVRGFSERNIRRIVGKIGQARKTQDVK